MNTIFRILLGCSLLALFSCNNSTNIVSSDNSYEVIELPDGSIAYLNSNSSVEYNTDFEQRLVKQSGEVFYDVRKGSTPFVVQTEVGKVQVLGTRFNVKEDGEELDVEVEEGTVEMKVKELSQRINRGQKAFFKKSKKSIETGVANLKHKKWMKNLKKEFKRLGKQIQKESKKLEKETQKAAKDIKKESKKLGKDLKKGLKKLKEELD